MHTTVIGVRWLIVLDVLSQIRQCNGITCIDVLEVETNIFHAIVFIFQITIAIGILVVMLFESYHMSLEDFLHRLFAIFKPPFC